MLILNSSGLIDYTGGFRVKVLKVHAPSQRDFLLFSPQTVLIDRNKGGMNESKT